MVFLRRYWALSLLLLLTGCTSKQPLEPIQIAHLLPLTGADKKAAEEARQGMLLAVEDINADDQRISGRTVLVRNIDSRDDPEQIQAEAVRLVTLNRVAAFISSPNSNGSKDLVRTAQGYGIPVVIPADFPSETGLDNVLALGVPAATRGEILARYAVKELKPKRVFVLTDQRNPLAVALAAAFIREWPRTGSSSVEEWPFRNDAEQIDFPYELTKKAPAVVLFAGTLADFFKFQGTVHEKKADVTLLYGGEDEGARVLQKQDVEVVTATAFATTGLTKKGEEFAKRYEERFHEPPTLPAAQAYDAGRLLFEAMQSKKNGTASSLREDLMKLESFDSVTGKITWKDRKPQRPVFIAQIKDNAVTVVETISPLDK